MLKLVVVVVVRLKRKMRKKRKQCVWYSCCMMSRIRIIWKSYEQDCVNLHPLHPLYLPHHPLLPHNIILFGWLQRLTSQVSFFLSALPLPLPLPLLLLLLLLLLLRLQTLRICWHMLVSLFHPLIYQVIYVRLITHGPLSLSDRKEQE